MDIDSQTGALTLNASVLFDYDKAELTDAGKQELAEILPIYCKVLLQDDYKKYLAEIIIDGYTDTDGDYYYNLELSQKRSLAVAEYLTEIRENFLNADQISDLQEYLTVNGHSMANPVLDADGNVVDEWTSTEESHVIKELVVGNEYTMTETKPADGYVTAESITFTVENTADAAEEKSVSDDTGSTSKSSKSSKKSSSN